MPHLVIEYSGNLKSAIKETNIVEILHHAVMQCGLFKPEDVKTRARKAKESFVGEKGADGTFVHIELSIKPGRTPEQRDALSQTLLDMLQSHVKGIDQGSVDIRELTSSYRKFTK